MNLSSVFRSYVGYLIAKRAQKAATIISVCTKESRYTSRIRHFDIDFMMQTQQTDHQLVKLVQQGHKAAFDLLVVKYQNRVAAVVAQFIKDPDTVLDVTQESFVRAWRAIDSFRMDSAFYTWLYRIAVNVAKNTLAKQKRHDGQGRLDIEFAEQVNDSEQFSDLATPEGLEAKQRLQQVIKQAISELPDDMQRAFLLREFDGLSYEQIAEQMNTPIGTVRSRIFRARETVELKMKPYLFD